MSNLLGSATSPVENPVRCRIMSPGPLLSCLFSTRFSQALWLFLALAVRLILETEYKVRRNNWLFLCHFIWAFSSSGPNLTSAVSRHLPGNFSVLLLPFQFYIGESGVLPFLLLLPLLMVSGHLHLPSLRFLHPVTIFISSTFTSYTRSTSLLTAALMLCGVDQAKVALLTR